MQDLRVGAGALAAGKSKLSGAAGDIQATLTRIKNDVAALEAQWQGQASGAFNQFYVQWDRIGVQTQQALEGLSQKLGVADVNYTDTESSNTKLFSI